MDYRTDDVKIIEDRFINNLNSNRMLYEFASSLLFKLIQKCKTVNFDKTLILSIINTWINDVENQKILIKFGYNCNKTPDICNKLLDIMDESEFLLFNDTNNISISQLMGALYKFVINNTLTQLILKNDQILLDSFMAKVIQYFSLPITITFDEIVGLLPETQHHWFYLWTISFLNNDSKNLFHGNLINEELYIRKWNKDIEFSQTNKLSDYKLIRKNKILESKTKDIEKVSTDIDYVMLGNTYITPTPGSLWFKLMKTYKKEIIAGPSSSCILTYQMVFNILKILDVTLENRVKLLLCCILHYYQFSHSISEILQQYTVEAYFENIYNLSENDVEYINKLINIANIDLSTIDIPGNTAGGGKPTFKESRNSKRKQKRSSRKSSKKR